VERNDGQEIDLERNGFCAEAEVVFRRFCRADSEKEDGIGVGERVMNIEDRETWLAKLKVGDRVIIRMQGQGFLNRWCFATVFRVFKRHVTVMAKRVMVTKKITAIDESSMIKMSFRVSDGMRMGKTGRWVFTLKPLPPDIDRELEKIRLVNGLRRIDWRRLPLCQLQDVWENVKSPCEEED